MNICRIYRVPCYIAGYVLSVICILNLVRHTAVNITHLGRVQTLPVSSHALDKEPGYDSKSYPSSD